MPTLVEENAAAADNSVKEAAVAELQNQSLPAKGKRRRKRKKKRKKKRKTATEGMQPDPKRMGKNYTSIGATGCHVAHFSPGLPKPLWIVGADIYNPSEFGLEVRGNTVHSLAFSHLCLCILHRPAKFHPTCLLTRMKAY